MTGRSSVKLNDYTALVTFNHRNRDAWVAGIAQRLAPGTRILDVGAGECRYRSLFAHCQYQAQDFAQYKGTAKGLLKQNWSYEKLDFWCDATSIPTPDGSFDAVLCTEVLEHVPEPIKVLQEIGRILRSGGTAFISAPLGSGLHQQPYHYYGGYTPYFYRKFLTEFGFTTITVEPNGGFFRLLLQEINRGLGIVKYSGRYYPRWHPTRYLLRAVGSRYFASWLTRLDEEIPVNEVTVRYHLEAVKSN